MRKSANWLEALEILKRGERTLRRAACGLGLCAAVLAAAALLAAPARAETVGGVSVQTNDTTGLYLRAEPSLQSVAIGTVPSGAYLLVEEVLDDWYKVSWEGQVGYVSAYYAEFSESVMDMYELRATTLGTDVNIRSGASTDAGVVKTLPRAGTEVTVTGVAGSWLQVREAGGAVGFIRSDLVNCASLPALPGAAAAEEETAEVQARPMASPDAGTLGEQIIATAREYIGYNYTWGGMSPETGFDCSGFVNYIYQLYGYSMERVAQNIYNTNGTYVSWDQLQPGDLLFFGYGSSITHVGLYAGDGRMVHSSTYRTGVIEVSLEYAGMNYIGAKRII